MPPTSFLLRHPATVTATATRFFSNSTASLNALETRLHNRFQPSLEPQHNQTPQNEEDIFTLLQSINSTAHFQQLHTHFIRNYLFDKDRLSLKFLIRASVLFPKNISYVFRVFGQIPEPDIYRYNFMISALSRTEVAQKGLLLYNEMRKEGVFSDALTLSFCMKCCVKKMGFFEGLQIHRRVLGDGHLRDYVLMTGLMEFYSVFGKSGDACKVFDEMRVRDTVAYNGLISCLLSNKRMSDSLAIFDSMLSLGSECRPSDVTCLLVLQACSHLGALDFGKRVWDYAEKCGYGDYINLNNALIKMYLDCGVVDEAYTIFDRMPVKSFVSWTTMILGLGMNGLGKEGVKLFNKMLETGIAPDDKALTAVLYAYSHSGLFDEGLYLFENMSKEFGIRPNIHHYGCAVHILSRQGLLEKAYNFILSMPDKPNATIWRILLVACRKFKDVHHAERALEHIVKLNAVEAGDCIHLLNTYSCNEKWDKVTKLKILMSENKITTALGSSTIEIKGMVHEFAPSDMSCPSKDEVYEMLHEILQQLKNSGYVPQTSLEPPDLNATEKGRAPCYHSEKLAIAFGVLSTSPDTTIRITNSVRICDDCHDFAKVFSSAYNRRVIIRDRIRIHSFSNGDCSCRVFW